MLSRHPDRLDQPDPDTGHTPLHYAARSEPGGGRWSTQRERREDSGVTWRWCVSVRNGQVEVVRLLLEKGANVDCRDGQVGRGERV